MADTSNLRKLQLPPGVARAGTLYASQGRWFDANLVRWHEGAMLPVRGWSPLFRSDTGAQVNVGAPVRGMHSWRDNQGGPILAFGTPDSLYIYRVLSGDQLEPGTLSGFVVISDVGA